MEVDRKEIAQEHTAKNDNVVFAKNEDIKQYLQEEYWEKASPYKIPKDFLISNPETVMLILDSLSISSVEEKQHWFDLILQMDDRQKNELRDILDREKKKFASICNVASVRKKRYNWFMSTFIICCIVCYIVMKFFHVDSIFKINQIENVVTYATIEIVKDNLHEEYVKEASNYDIPEGFVVNYPDIVELILWSKTLSTHEDKQHWFDLYVEMNEEQINSLKDILTREKEELERIYQKYWTGVMDNL